LFPPSASIEEIKVGLFYFYTVTRPFGWLVGCRRAARLLNWIKLTGFSITKSAPSFFLRSSVISVSALVITTHVLARRSSDRM